MNDEVWRGGLGKQYLSVGISIGLNLLLVVVRAHSVFRKSIVSPIAVARFAQAMAPDYELSGVHAKMISLLEALLRGTILRLALILPPRCGKTELGNFLLPLYSLGRNPREQIISVSHGCELSETWGRRTRNALTDPVYQQIFPNTKLSANSAAVYRFETSVRGSYLATGRNGPNVPDQQTVGAAFFALFVRRVRIFPFPSCQNAAKIWPMAHSIEPPGPGLHQIAAAPLKTIAGAAPHCCSMRADFAPLIQTKSRQTPPDSMQLSPFFVLDRACCRRDIAARVDRPAFSDPVLKPRTSNL